MEDDGSKLKNIRGFLMKRRKSPLKGWHKVREGGREGGREGRKGRKEEGAVGRKGREVLECIQLKIPHMPPID